MVACFNIIKSTKRRDANTNMVSVPCSDTSIDNIKGQTRTVFAATAIFIITLVGLLNPKLMQQITMRAMNFYAIKSCFFSVLSRKPKVSDNLLYFLKRGWTRGRRFNANGLIITVTQCRAHAHMNIRRRNRRFAIRLDAFV